jgi:DNA-binding response OmpR family regulator
MTNTAMIIEENQDATEIVSQAFTASGFAVETFTDAPEAIKRLLSLAPRVIVIDSTIDSTPLLSVLKDAPGLKDTIVIVTTSDGVTAEAFRETDGIDYILIKPTGFGKLRELAEKVANHHPRRTGHPALVISSYKISMDSLEN